MRNDRSGALAAVLGQAVARPDTSFYETADDAGGDAVTGAAKPAAGGSQMLLFLKPEVLRSPRLAAVGDMTEQALARFGLTIERVVVLSGLYMEQHGIVAAHYGVIDAVARDPIANLSEVARSRFRELHGHPVDARVVGGLGYLERHPGLDAEELARRWLARGADKLAGGTYCQPLPDEGLYLVNGFYPRMLVHFTRPASRVVGLVLRGDLAWARARRDLCGVTDPAKAAAGSLRAELLRGRDELGLGEISANLNGVHLSAGPLEALVELRRFASDLSRSSEPRPIEDFLFGRALVGRVGAKAAHALLGNPTVSTPAGARSVFDLTEEKDPAEALTILAGVAGAAPQ
jgi:hypothetical protein